MASQYFYEMRQSVWVGGQPPRGKAFKRMRQLHRVWYTLRPPCAPRAYMRWEFWEMQYVMAMGRRSRRPTIREMARHVGRSYGAILSKLTQYGLIRWNGSHWYWIRHKRQVRVY